MACVVAAGPVIPVPVVEPTWDDSSPIALSACWSGREDDVALPARTGARDHSSLVLASKKPENCANVNLCRRYLFSCPSHATTTSTSPDCAKKGNSFCGA
jgi:hypothetical protein